MVAAHPVLSCRLYVCGTFRLLDQLGIDGELEKPLGYSQNESIVTSDFVTESDNTTDFSVEPQCAGRKQ
ncbi:hypothetical protein GCM10010946_07630 [Undibacterium squillarum]|uniref:Uncharacterized protein n=1 Tax=Undibacterium squillarum TaxID=1131567 RepID=A0ABQ2XVE7_9BURK|nr:hypothetical protein GCM10010946_07630 [Undibacterium squillarum]